MSLGRAASPGGSRMATTLVACALRYDRVVVAHVGDSRCYLIRHGSPSQITRDHTVVAEQVRLGLLSEREAAEAETRHLLSRSLGNDLFVNVEIGDRQVHVDDVLLLCSDGLHGPVDSAGNRRNREVESRSRDGGPQSWSLLPMKETAAIM